MQLGKAHIDRWILRAEARTDMAEVKLWNCKKMGTDLVMKNSIAC